MAKVTKNTGDTSDDLFHAGATLAARIAFIAEHECGVDPIELFVLWHIKYYGKTNSNGLLVILRHDVSDVLKGKFRYSDSDVTKLLDSLHERGFIDRPHLTPQERTVLFGAESGTKLAVMLQPAGKDKIEEFKNQLKQKFDGWLSEQSKAIQYATRKFEPIVAGFAQWLLNRYQPTEKK